MCSPCDLVCFYASIYRVIEARWSILSGRKDGRIRRCLTEKFIFKMFADDFCDSGKSMLATKFNWENVSLNAEISKEVLNARNSEISLTEITFSEKSDLYKKVLEKLKTNDD